MCFLFPVFGFAQEEVSVTSVQVWVKVTDRAGKSIAGLAQADFELQEDGKPMDLTCFEESVLELPAEDSPPLITQQPEQASVSSGSVRRIAVLIDLFHSSRVEFELIREALQNFLSKLEGHAELLLAITAPPADTMILMPYTKNFAQAWHELSTISGNALRDQDIVTKRKNITKILDRARGARPEIVAEVVQSAYWEAEVYKREEEKDVEYSLKALEKFGDQLLEQPGREHVSVLFISGGMNAEPGRQYFDLVDRVAEEELGERASIELGGVRGNSAYLHTAVEKSIGKLNRNNLTIYAVNTRGPMNVVDNIIESDRRYMTRDNSYVRDYQDFMNLMAEDTGGLSFYHSSNFKGGFDKILSDLDHNYLLCYIAPEHKSLGEYHRIKVTANARDAKIRHRLGYVD